MYQGRAIISETGYTRWLSVPFTIQKITPCVLNFTKDNIFLSRSKPKASFPSFQMPSKLFCSHLPEVYRYLGPDCRQQSTFDLLELALS